ncbi:MAG TPA: FmdB family zinc ribbon protein [Thermoanaerobaculia bacterium]
MPIYEYECRSCGKRTEILQRMDEAPLAACPQCGGEVKKLFSAPAVQFKGSGWYVTDYAGKKGGGGGGGAETKSESKSDKSEKKEAPAEAKSSGSSSSGSGSGGGAE